MDKIYSRRRIKVPRVFNYKWQKKTLKQKIALNTAMILIIAVLSFIFIVKAITPIIDRLCEDTAMTKATIITNNMATEVMKDYTYNDMIKIYKDNNR